MQCICFKYLSWSFSLSEHCKSEMYNYDFVYLFFIEGLCKKLCFFTLIFSVHCWMHIGFELLTSDERFSLVEDWITKGLHISYLKPASLYEVYMCFSQFPYMSTVSIVFNRGVHLLSFVTERLLLRLNVMSVRLTFLPVDKSKWHLCFILRVKWIDKRPKID